MNSAATGCLTLTLTALVEAFGPPRAVAGSSSAGHLEWELPVPDGTVVITDWPVGHLCCHGGGCWANPASADPAEDRWWHLTGPSDAANRKIRCTAAHPLVLREAGPNRNLCRFCDA